MLGALALVTLLQGAADAPVAAPAPVEQAESVPVPIPTHISKIHSRAWVPAIVGSTVVVGGAAVLISGLMQQHHAITEVEQSKATSFIVGGTEAMLAGALAITIAVIMWLWHEPVTGYQRIP